MSRVSCLIWGDVNGSRSPQLVVELREEELEGVHGVRGISKYEYFKVFVVQRQAVLDSRLWREVSPLLWPSLPPSNKHFDTEVYVTYVQTNAPTLITES